MYKSFHKTIYKVLSISFLTGFFCENMLAEALPDTVSHEKTSKLISSFETTDEVKNFSQKVLFSDHYGSGVELSKNYVSDGKYSGKFIFTNKSFYPSSGIKFDKPENWSDYDYLEMDVFNDQAWPIRFTVVINKASYGFNLPARQRTHLAVDLRELAGGNLGKILKIDTVERFWFWVRPPEEGIIVVYIDNIRLSDKKTAMKNIAFNEKSELENALKERMGNIERIMIDFEKTLKHDSELKQSINSLLENAGALLQNIQRYENQELKADINKIETEYLKLWMNAWKGRIFSNSKGNSSLALGTLDCMAKIFRDRPYSFDIENEMNLSIAKNEYGAFQIAVIPNNENLNITKFEFTDFVSNSGTVLSKDIFNYNFEAYLLPPEEDRKGCLNFLYQRTYTGPFHEPYPKDGWPDILLNRKTLELDKNFIQPVWISFQTPENAVSGNYKGKVICHAENHSPVSVNVNLKIWDFKIPEAPAFTAMAHPRIRDMRKLDKRPAADIVNNVINNYCKHKVQLFMDSGDYLFPQIKSKDNKIEIDFSKFDLMADHLLNKLRMKFIRFPLNVGYGVSNKHTILGEYPFSEGKKKTFKDVCKKITEHLKEKGWLDKTLLWVGEGGATIRNLEIARMVKDVCPDVKIFCFGMHEVKTGHEKYDVDIWGTVEALSTMLPFIYERREKGEEVFLYNGADEIAFSGTMNRAYFWRCWRDGFPGMIYWTAGAWNCIVRAPNAGGVTWGEIGTASEDFGDGVLYWPDRDNNDQGICNSIRWELWRIGIDDYEYFAILQKGIEKLKSKNWQYKELIAESENTLKTATDFLSDYRTREVKSTDIINAKIRMAVQIEEIKKIIGDIQ